MYNDINHSAFVWGAFVLAGVAVIAAAVGYRRRNKYEDGYQPIMI